MTNNVLVTGGTGFIGGHLIKLLLKQKYQVHALLRNAQQSRALPAEIIIKIGDLTDPESLTQACKGINTIYHLAGFAHAINEQDPKFNNKHHLINFLGTKNLITAAEFAGVKNFIFFSSSKAVADTSHCINEDWKKFPDSTYGIAKRNAETLVLELSKRCGIHTCILRPTLVYGPGCKGNLYSMIRAIDKGFFIPIPNIHNRRSMISNNDICQAAILAANNANANGKIYFVTDGNCYSTYQLYTAITTSLGKQVPRWYLPLPFFRALGYIGNISEKILRRNLPINIDKIDKLFGSAEFDSTRIQNDLGFKPKHNLISMLPEIIATYRHNLILS